MYKVNAVLICFAMLFDVCFRILLLDTCPGCSRWQYQLSTFAAGEVRVKSKVNLDES